MRSIRPKRLGEKVILAYATSKELQLWKRNSVDGLGMDSEAGHAGNIL